MSLLRRDPQNGPINGAYGPQNNQFGPPPAAPQQPIRSWQTNDSYRRPPAPPPSTPQQPPTGMWQPNGQYGQPPAPPTQMPPQQPPTGMWQPNGQYGQPPAPPTQMPQQRPRGTWQSNGSMTDAQAHRDAKYQIPSMFMQILLMFRTQMALYSKRKAIYVTLVMAIMIPLIYMGLKGLLPAAAWQTFAEDSGSGMIGLLLSMMPFIMALFTAFVCGSLIPSEFTERSAYMNMALPMSRLSFCLGKYLAGLVITIGVFIFAYGMAMIGSLTAYDYFDEEALGMSFVITLLATLFYSSFSFMMGCFMKRGASLVSMVTLVFIFPLIELYLYANDYMDKDALMLLPNLLPDMACLVLGSHFAASPVGAANTFVGLIDPSQFPILSCLVITIVCVVLFLTIGVFAVNRREM